MTPLTRKQLDPMQCAHCASGEEHQHTKGPFWLHGRCHPDQGTWASYTQGVLTVSCRLCKAVVAQIEVAP